ncbi:hypothetical protein HMPREF1987_01216 [Peptostreptococcaceae bacterium oral taxon 113 str. W5053]|nr:hypothetical protein HMPREF1987_01216 [Peptostreptococcaceae bacterium oral taxon 113 str. W5053]
MSEQFNETMKFNPLKEDKKKIQDILSEVYKALKEKGYNPENQLIGYILSGDPTYITSYLSARTLIRQVDRDELLEEILNFYMKSHGVSE